VSSVLGVMVVSSHDATAQSCFGGEMESLEDCLREATECDRLAELANTQATRTLLAVAVLQWRKLAEKAAERQKDPLAVRVGSDTSKLARKPSQRHADAGVSKRMQQMLQPSRSAMDTLA
jgi:hypothetical protein